MGTITNLIRAYQQSRSGSEGFLVPPRDFSSQIDKIILRLKKEISVLSNMISNLERIKKDRPSAIQSKNPQLLRSSIQPFKLIIKDNLESVQDRLGVLDQDIRQLYLAVDHADWKSTGIDD